MDLKMKSLFLLVLIMYGVDDVKADDDDIWDGPDNSNGGGTTLAPIIAQTAGGECTVGGEGGICVPTMAYCSTPHYGGIGINWRASHPCKVGVCCKQADVILAPAGAAIGLPSTSPIPPIINKLGSKPTGTSTCGIQKLQSLPGFVKTKSNEADPGEFPWAVNLMVLAGMIGSKGKYSYTGTGSLIHDRVVLTAAHVLKNKDINNLKAVIGEHDQFKKVLPKKLLSINEVVVHDNFVSSNGDYNIALVFLKKSALAGLPHVGTVCLPPVNYMATAGASCVFSGWGLDSALQLQMQIVKTVVPIVGHTACEQKLQESPKLGPGFQLLPSLMCAGGEVGKDICGGGGGSPLVCPIEGDESRYVQTGIVSWGTDSCGVDGAPLVFADVAAVRPWIDQKMAEHQYSTESYTY